MLSVFDNIEVGDQLGPISCHSQHFGRPVIRADLGEESSHIAVLLPAFPDHRDEGKKTSSLRQGSR
jgi:hypothetical protein